MRLVLGELAPLKSHPRRLSTDQQSKSPMIQRLFLIRARTAGLSTCSQSQEAQDDDCYRHHPPLGYVHRLHQPIDVGYGSVQPSFDFVTHRIISQKKAIRPRGSISEKYTFGTELEKS